MTPSEWLRKTHPESVSLAYWNSTVKKPPKKEVGLQFTDYFVGLVFHLKDSDDRVDIT